MTKKGLDNNKNKYFVICMIVTNNNKLLKKQYSRFISSNLSDIRKVDLHNNMFYQQCLQGDLVACLKYLPTAAIYNL